MHLREEKRKELSKRGGKKERDEGRDAEEGEENEGGRVALEEEKRRIWRRG